MCPRFCIHDQNCSIVSSFLKNWPPYFIDHYICHENDCLRCIVSVTAVSWQSSPFQQMFLLQRIRTMMRRPILVLWWRVLCAILVSSESEYCSTAFLFHFNTYKGKCKMLIIVNYVWFAAIAAMGVKRSVVFVDLSSSILSLYLKAQGLRECLPSVSSSSLYQSGCFLLSF
jgi:hypothetical protein